MRVCRMTSDYCTTPSPGHCMLDVISKQVPTLLKNSYKTSLQIVEYTSWCGIFQDSGAGGDTNQVLTINSINHFLPEFWRKSLEF